MHYTYKTRLTCSSEISFDIEDNIVRNISFIGGCNGNLKAVSILADGLTTDELIAKCRGITCGRKPTSCPDQLATAVAEALRKASE